MIRGYCIAEAGNEYVCEGFKFINVNAWRASCWTCGIELHKAVIRGHVFFHLKQFREVENCKKKVQSERNEVLSESSPVSKAWVLSNALNKAKKVRNYISKLNQIAVRTNYILQLRGFRKLTNKN